MIGPVTIRGDLTPSSGNLLAVPLGGDPRARVVWVYLHPTEDTYTRRDQKDVVWTVAATLRTLSPGSVFNDAASALFQLLPARVLVKPVRARRSLVLACFLPGAPIFDFLDIFLLGPGEPDYVAQAWAFPDATVYPACGLFPVPFGAVPGAAV